MSRIFELVIRKCSHCGADVPCTTDEEYVIHVYCQDCIERMRERKVGHE